MGDRTLQVAFGPCLLSKGSWGQLSAVTICIPFLFSPVFPLYLLCSPFIFFLYCYLFFSTLALLVYFIPSFQSSPPYFFLLFFKLLMLSSTEQWCHHYFIRPAQAAASGLWSMCELGRASILRVLASGPPPISVSQHICQVLLVLFLGLPMEVCRGL